ncbi:glycoside hydrolase family 3 protein [Asanoa sp. WMMD1127]|uniref:glycoside hydrolase family 3 N-terminal domain-containing protein n=1 Tax=Asanoa sp. WMMD1127 TaxID=3016107 RepID=UPI0024180B1C|nr:glycoside hydrolase family 3 protein [Asanoa sp. WMMD1127]MDG4824347.1 glycoside hydrolase family 3 protein [Asanoa sp. WMMD1127]
MTEPGGELLRLAATVLQPGFVGTAPPDWVRRWLGEGLGGVALFARNVRSPEQIAALTATLRAERADVLVAIDEEAGDVTRFESRTGSSRPGNLALGAVDDVALTREVACDLGRELAAVGVNLDYAPDADVNNNPDNPVIGVRSFGADPALVARHTGAWVTGLQAAGVAACAKHFPGHGDTAVDSHHDLPHIPRDRAGLDAVELLPFRAAIAAGVQAVMTGHLLVPAIDPSVPATLSRNVLTGLLRDELGFEGAVITDAMEMRAVVDRYGFEGAVVAALAAGADAICVGGENADEATADRLRTAIARAVVDGRLAEDRLVEAAKRVQHLAAWAATARASSAPGPWYGAAGSPVGLAAARRAVKVGGFAPSLPLPAAPHVVELSPPANIAVGTDTPWGVAAPLAALLPGTTAVRLTPADQPSPTTILAASAARPLVVVVRDLHRHAWMSTLVDALLSARPDSVVVELGVPAAVIGATHLATHGATRSGALAAAELLAGRRP